MANSAPASLAGLRDKAILLLGFAAALRRSELVALNIADVRELPDGLLLTIRRSKTDQEGANSVIAVPYGAKNCPVTAYRSWISAAAIKEGPVFRPINRAGRISMLRLSDRSIANLVKKYAGRCGFDPDLYSGHSLRAGFLTSAAANGASIFKMMDISRHNTADSLRCYIRDADIFRDHAGAGLL
jgi:site-specific recombinase XerD